MMADTTELWIEDKKGVKHFRTICATQYKQSEVRNLQTHLNTAKQYPDAYHFLDLETAEIKEREYKS